MRLSRTGKMCRRMLAVGGRVEIPPKVRRFLVRMQYQSKPRRLDLERMHRLWGWLRPLVEMEETQRMHREFMEGSGQTE